MVEEVVADGELNGLVLSFRHSVALRVVGGCHEELGTQRLLHTLPKR